MNTVEALKELYKSFGGKLTDTYDDIADGIPVGNYSVIPDCFAALAEIAGGSIELPVVTQADAGDVLTVGEDGKWTNEEPAKELPTVTASDNGSVLSVVDGAWAKKSTAFVKKEVTLETSGATNIPLTDLEFIPSEEILLVFDATLSSTSGVITVNSVGVDAHTITFKPTVEMIKVSDGYITKAETGSGVSNPSVITIQGAGISFVSGKVTLYYR